MSARAALVDCVVLSLQDACVFYPCCKDCFSKIQVELQDAKRCRCAKCGYICLRGNVDHRYRLSLKVIRDKCIFGVTVFGTSLNAFFGIPASGLQRLVEHADGPVETSTRCTLLVKAVKDCFIGRHFIFGIKVTETEREPWLRQTVTNCSRNEDTVQLIASQMILPKALGLGGCTVVSYFRILLQKAAESELGSADLRKPSRNPETPLLLPHHSPASSFNSASLSTSGLLSQPLQRSQFQDCTLTPTPPWQQSLGLVTSSAEQEEGCSIQESDDVKSRQTEKSKTQNHNTRTDNLKNPEVTEERGVSPLLPLQRSLCSTQSFAKYSFSCVDEAVGDTSITEPWFSLSPTDNNSSGKKLSPRKLTQTYLSDSLAWEDLPLSESLTHFLGDKNKDFIIAGESKPDLNVQNRKEISRSILQDKSQDKNFSTESESVHSSFKDIKNSHSQIFLGNKDTAAPNEADGRDLPDLVCKKPAGFFNRSQTKNKCNRVDEKSFSASFENTEEEQLQIHTYDCSADLFSSSLMIDMSTNTIKTQVETVRTTTEACVLLSVPNKQHPRREMTNSSQLTPDKQKVTSNKCTYEDNLTPSGMFDLHFVPPSQSTPIVKSTALTRSPDCSYITSTFDESTSQIHSPDSSSCSRNLPQLYGKKTAKIPSSNSKCVRLNQRPWCCKESAKENLMWRTKLNRHRLNSKRRFWKDQNHLLAQEPQSVQRGAPNTGTPRRQKHTCDSRHFDVTVCDKDDSALFVPPTPAVKKLLSVKLRDRSQTECSSSDFGKIVEEQQRHGVNCQSSVLDQTVKSSQKGVVHAGSSDTETFEKAALDGSICYLVDGENEACDWSRDLFSDSV
ncbi:DNA damage-induced apoptosis suppressor protein [Labrus bergylta]|uniref:DNA damage-induced apoptosis suppressor protein n=1 Tax=Labrus bergylta TaxID=56723 RepID=UPI0033142913